jgi:hypothetical protein
MSRTTLAFLLALGISSCGGAKAPYQIGGDGGQPDGVTLADGAGEIAPGADTVPGEDTVPGLDTIPGEDTPPPEDTLIPADTVPDAPPDATAPAGCCLSDADCNDPETAAIMVCAGQGHGEPAWAGVCVTPASEAGRCWTDGECPDGQLCHGAGICGCNVDCDMDMWEGPGVCVTPGAACETIKPSWADEVCDAASIVVWDGQACVSTCPGCCGCQGWCDYTFQTLADCQAVCFPPACAIFDGGCDDAMPDAPWWYWDGQACIMEDACVCEGCPGTFPTLEACKDTCVWSPPACSVYITALSDSHHGLFKGDDGCPVVSPMTVRCAGDADCVGLANPGLPDLGGTCVLGNCVWCWNDDGCLPGHVCRGGRCVDHSPADCPDPGACDDPGCWIITPSEAPCPVCTCDDTYGMACEADLDCLPFSFHPFSRCVYGRCADCRNDEDCDWGRCMQPGICYEMTPPEDLLFGTWLIGWGGGMDHFSYFRFEADGTLRRAAYEADGAWSDDIPPFWDVCDPGWPVPAPLIGTWEPEVTQSGFLVIRLRLNLPCASDQGWTIRWGVNWLEGSPWTADFDDIDGDMDLMGWKVDGTACLDDFSECPLPANPWF